MVWEKLVSTKIGYFIGTLYFAILLPIFWSTSPIWKRKLSFCCCHTEKTGWGFFYIYSYLCSIMHLSNVLAEHWMSKNMFNNKRPRYYSDWHRCKMLQMCNLRSASNISIPEEYCSCNMIIFELLMRCIFITVHLWFSIHIVHIPRIFHIENQVPKMKSWENVHYRANDVCMWHNLSFCSYSIFRHYLPEYIFTDLSIHFPHFNSLRLNSMHSNANGMELKRISIRKLIATIDSQWVASSEKKNPK